MWLALTRCTWAAACDLGYYNDGGTCKLCNIGSYGNTNFITGESECIKCPLGTFGKSMISEGDWACYTCPTGTKPYGSDVIGCSAQPGFFFSPATTRAAGGMYADVTLVDGVVSKTANASTHSADNDPFNAFSGVISTPTQASTWRTASHTYHGDKKAGVGAYVASGSPFRPMEYSGTEEATAYELYYGLEDMTFKDEGVAYGEWIQVQLAIPIALGGFAIRAGYTSGDGAPVELMVLGSTDGKRWYQTCSQRELSWTAGELKSFKNQSPLWSIFSYFRLVVVATGITADGEVEIDEWYIFACLPQKCQPGEYLPIPSWPQAVYQCSLCTAGSYSDTSGATGCSPCPPATISTDVGASACKECEAGTYAHPYLTLCMPCLLGMYSATTGKTACQTCQAGTYNDLITATACKECSANTYSMEIGAVGPMVCKACPPGTQTTVPGATTCCPLGTTIIGTPPMACMILPGYTATPSSISAPPPLCMTSNTCTAGASVYNASASTSRLSNEPFNAFTAGTPVSQGWISASWTLFHPGHLGPGGYSRRTASGAYTYDYPSILYQLESISIPVITILTVQGPDSLVIAYRQLRGEWLEMLVQPPIVLWKYQIQPPSPLTTRIPFIASILASTDRKNWMELDIVGYRTWTENETMTYVVQQEKSAWRPFSYFRLMISSTGYSSDAETQLGRWTLFPAVIQKCASGTFQPERSMTPNTCTECPSGQESLSGASSCITCPIGTFLSPTGCASCSTRPPPGWFMEAKQCSLTPLGGNKECQACSLIATPCTNTTDTMCGEICTKLPPWQPEYPEWASEDYKCKQGQYLRGFKTKDDKDCAQCPPGLVGRNRLYCERCGPLEEPYFLDQSSCVCTPPARMNATGGCACPDGRYESHGACEPCGNNTFGEGGVCYPCAPGNYSSGEGATECRACPEGKYRASGQAECAGCSLGEGWYSTDSGAEACVQCNTSCAKVGLRESRRCPGDTSGRYAICATCPQPLPANTSWTSPHGNCMYACNQGFYSLTGRGGCAPCSTAPCPPGFAWSACATNADRGCDEPCTNASKPFFNSKWVPSRERGCPWECEEGYLEVRSDYVMFQLVECAVTKQ